MSKDCHYALRSTDVRCSGYSSIIFKQYNFLFLFKGVIIMSAIKEDVQTVQQIVGALQYDKVRIAQIRNLYQRTKRGTQLSN